MKKQTAVEWLLEHLEPNILWTDKAEKIAEQAKQMEKEQIINAHKQASIEAGFEDSAEDWANEYWEMNYGV